MITCICVRSNSSEDEDEYGAFVVWWWWESRSVCGEKPVSVPCCPPQTRRWPSHTFIAVTQCPNDTLVSKKGKFTCRNLLPCRRPVCAIRCKGKQVFFLTALVYYSVVTPGGTTNFHAIFDVCPRVLSNLLVAVTATSIVRSFRCWRIVVSDLVDDFLHVTPWDKIEWG